MLKRLMPQWEVFARRGRGWQYIGVFPGPTSRLAALAANLACGRKWFGVRPDGSRDKLFTHRIKRDN
jgi:hypothetical protein